MTTRLLLLGLVGPAAGALAFPQPTGPGLFVWNASPSIPVGLYRIADSHWRKGDAVAIRPERHLSTVLGDAGVLKPGRLLLKRVAAVQGDAVCRRDANVTVNGQQAAIARETDAAGRRLPVWSGCLTLGDREVFLLGDIDASFDSRYFGAVSSASIVGRLSPVLVWNEPHGETRP
jgi:conjugative transfer signal peptidase TraF